MTSQFNPYRDLGYAELCGRRKDFAKLLHAAQAARKYAERNLTLIVEALNTAPQPERYEASDHAVVRYLERVEGIDISAVRETIQMNCEQGNALIGEKLRGQDGYLYCVNNDGFVTTVLPLKALVDEVAESERALRERPRPNPSQRRRLRHKRAANEYLALAAAARQGGDVQQAPAESPQSGGEAVTPNLPSPPSRD